MAPLAARSRRPACLLALLSVAAALFLTPPALAAGGGETGQVTVFWGRNKAEGSLREACDSGMYTMVTMSFLDVFGANGKYHLDLSGHDLSSVGADIKHCQFKGVPVSLSIGGYGTGYSLPSNRSALDLFDLFLEHGTPADRYDVLALELAKHNIRGGPGKPLHLTATVRCGYPPAAHMGRALATGIFERVHVRTYESDKWCNQNLGWEGSWDKWTAAYPATRFYVGLTADDKSHQWVHPKNVYYGVAPVAQKKDNYGGIMLWDRYFDKQTNYSSLIKYYA
ncbi:unnamed protein product [Triticum turgidum subsp. durum]|uniref:GH18 domain-containing protein n=1 Tax=Triticum turgidum subsp. durum TaxID=4567 RepID=A0A9R0T028_TRITD|nr:unnamed protein product [Triticum turgidum subsp. durum]